MDFLRENRKLRKLAMLSCISLSMGLTACTSYENVPLVRDLKILQPSDYHEYIIQPGDNIDVKFFYSQDLNDNVTVRPDGDISLQLIDDVQVAGLTVSELDTRLTKMYRGKLPDGADVSVIMKSFSDQRIYITGEVARPGEYDLKHKLTILQAVTAAGGFNDSAKRDAVLLIRQEEEDAPKVFLVRLKDEDLIKTGESGTYNMLQPRDTIIVPKSNIAKVDLFMDQYVRDVLRFNGFSAGISGVYELNNKDTLGGTN